MYYAALLPISGFMLFGLCLGGGCQRRKALLSFLPLCVLVAAVLAVSGCGGGGGSKGSPGTPSGNYTVTITGKDANGMAQSNTCPVTVLFTVN